MRQTLRGQMKPLSFYGIKFKPPVADLPQTKLPAKKSKQSVEQKQTEKSQ